jgi:hypothetical protein
MDGDAGEGGTSGTGAGGSEGTGGMAGAMGDPDADLGDAGTDGTPDIPSDMPMPMPMKSELGATCALPADCASNFCVEGICCNNACAGTCQTCAAATSKGTCRAAAAGTDPKNSCPDDGVATCQRNGMCDGSGACQRYPANTVCVAASCNNGQNVSASQCDQGGVCRAGTTVSCYPYACSISSNTGCMFPCASKVDCSGTAECFGGTCGGLLGTYFATETLSGRSVTRIDRNIDFYFESSPIATIPGDYFSIRWTGKVVAPATGTYTFSTFADDGVRLWVNDQQLINDWRVHAPEEYGGQVALTAGTPVSFKLEYFDSTVGGRVHLSWSGPGLAKQIIPVSAFRPD